MKITFKNIIFCKWMWKVRSKLIASPSHMVMVRVRVILFNVTFNSMSVILWWSVLFVEETGVPGGNHRPVASHWQTLSRNVVSGTLRHERDSNSQLNIVSYTSHLTKWSKKELKKNRSRKELTKVPPLGSILPWEGVALVLAWGTNV